MGGASARRGDLGPHKKAALRSQPDPSQGDGRRVATQQSSRSATRCARRASASRATGRAGPCAGPPTTWVIWLRRDTDRLTDRESTRADDRAWRHERRMTMFGFDQDEEQKFQQYAQAADQGDFSQIDHYEAAGSLQKFAQKAPPDLQQRAYAQAFSQMPDDYRQQFVQELPTDVQEQLDPSDPEAMAQGFAQVTQQRPNLLQEAGNVLHNPVAKVAVAGLAAVAAKHVWDQHEEGRGPSIGGEGGDRQGVDGGGGGGHRSGE